MVAAYNLPGELALMIGMVLFSCDEVDQLTPPNNNQVIVFLFALSACIVISPYDVSELNSPCGKSCNQSIRAAIR